MGEFKLSKNSKKNLRGVRKNIIKLIERSLAKSPHDFGIPQSGGLRTAREQNLLYQIRPRVTTLDGYRRKSVHQSGDAFDIFVYDEHGACWKCKEKYKEIANIIKAEFQLMQDEGTFKCEDKLTWGGNWKRFTDLPHFEIRISIGLNE